MAGRPVPVHAELHAGRGQQLFPVRAVAVYPPSRSASTRRSRRSTTAASASTGRGTFTVSRKLDLIVGVRADREHKEADLQTFFVPPIAPLRQVVTASDFSDVSPQFAAAYRAAPAATLYAHGGARLQGRRLSTRRRRPAPRPTARSTTGTTKAGVKSSALGGRLTASAARVPHRLGQPAGERAEPAGAGAVFHRQRRGREEHGRRARVRRAADGRRRRLCRRRRDQRAFPPGQHRRTASTSAATRPSNAPANTFDAGVQHLAPGLARRRADCCAARSSATASITVQRCEHDGTERLLARQFPRRPARQARCSAKPGCATRSIRVHPGGVRVPGLRRPGSSARTARPRTFGMRVGVTF